QIHTDKSSVFIGVYRCSLSQKILDYRDDLQPQQKSINYEHRCTQINHRLAPCASVFVSKILLSPFQSTLNVIQI
ncbi:hypothetical protein, partial [Fischerella muscicola]